MLHIREQSQTVESLFNCIMYILRRHLKYWWCLLGRAICYWLPWRQHHMAAGVCNGTESHCQLLFPPFQTGLCCLLVIISVSCNCMVVCPGYHKGQWQHWSSQPSDLSWRALMTLLANNLALSHAKLVHATTGIRAEESTPSTSTSTLSIFLEDDQ